MSFCYMQQNAPNLRLPQPDFGAQSDGTKCPESRRISSLGLDGLGDPHLCLWARASLTLHLTSEVLNNCCGSYCFTPKCELKRSACNFCIDAMRTWSCSSDQYLQLAFVHTQPSRLEHLRQHLSKSGKLRKTRRLTKSSTKQRSDKSNLLPVFRRGIPVAEVFFLGLLGAEGIKKDETQRALHASLSYSHRDVDFGDKPSEAVSNDVARVLRGLPPAHLTALSTSRHLRLLPTVDPSGWCRMLSPGLTRTLRGDSCGGLLGASNW